MAELTSRVRDHCIKLGARLVGFSSAERLDEAPVGHRPKDFLPGAQAVVVLGLPILRAYAGYPEFLRNSETVPESVAVETEEPIAGGLAQIKTRRVYHSQLQIADHVYRRCAYEFLNMELQRLSLYAALFLEEQGFPSIYMPTAYGSTFTWNMSNPRPNSMGPFSARHAAVAAGLGRFGLNNLVLTPRYGSFQRLVVVITTAPLVPDPLLEEEICLGEKCGLCRQGCPNGCFDAHIEEYSFGGTSVRVFAMDREACGRYEDPDRQLCTRQCLFHCPVGP